MQNRVFSLKVIVILFLVGLIIATVGVLILGFSNKTTTTEIEDRNGILFLKGQEKLFSGKIIDTVAQQILEYEVIDGRKNGEFKISSISGAIVMKGQLKDNLNEGEWCYYYPNGQIESSGNFSNNLTEGKWVWYFVSGKIREVGYFKEGKKNGAWIIYDENGKVKRKILFKDGQIIQDQELLKDMFT